VEGALSYVDREGGQITVKRVEGGGDVMSEVLLVRFDKATAQTYPRQRALEPDTPSYGQRFELERSRK